MKAQGKIILASASPRRKELLEQLGIPIEVIPSNVAEVGTSGEPRLIPLRMTVQKVKAVRSRLGPSFQGWVIGADTIVALEREVFGKPRDEDEARGMLRKLSGRTHQVFTAYRVESWTGEMEEGTVATNVTFAPLSEEEIDWYVRTREPEDKAGAYAIQGKGGVFVRAISGSYSNVVGLPLFEVVGALRDLGALV